MSQRSLNFAADSGRVSSMAGIAFITTGVLLFSVHNALGKWLSADFSPWQIMFFRGLFGCLPFAAWVLLSGRSSLLRSGQPLMQTLRALCGFSANLFFIFSYREMPLADAVAIGYAAPIFIVFLSVPLLSERVGIHRASAAFVGFLGILLIAQPGVGVLSAGSLYALAGTFCYSLLIITTRKIGFSDSALCTVVWSSGLYALACAAVMPFVWTTPGPTDSGLLVIIGLLGGTGMLLFAQAYRHAKASVLAPFDYTAMVWAVVFGFLIWGEIPGPAAVAGMVVIAATGLYLMRHERLQRLSADKP